MASNLNSIGISGNIFVIIVLVVVAQQLLSACQSLWGFVGPKLFHVKTKISKQKELAELTLKNAEDINKFIAEQTETNKAIQNDITVLSSKLDDISDVVVSVQIENMRSRILEFANGVTEGRLYTKEQYNHVMKTYNQYHEIINKRQIINNEVEISYGIIDKQYKFNMEYRGFLEDHMDQVNFSDQLNHRYEDLYNISGQRPMPPQPQPQQIRNTPVSPVAPVVKQPKAKKPTSITRRTMTKPIKTTRTKK